MRVFFLSSSIICFKSSCLRKSSWKRVKNVKSPKDNRGIKPGGERGVWSQIYLSINSSRDCWWWWVKNEVFSVTRNLIFFKLTLCIMAKKWQKITKKGRYDAMLTSFWINSWKSYKKPGHWFAYASPSCTIFLASKTDEQEKITENWI